MVRAVSLGAQVGFHVSWNGIERMGISSSSGGLFEVVGAQSIVYVFTELFDNELRGVSFVYVVDCLVEEVFVPIYFHGV